VVDCHCFKLFFRLRENETAAVGFALALSSAPGRAHGKLLNPLGFQSLHKCALRYRSGLLASPLFYYFAIILAP
jgi:hypothetical protein